MEPSHHGVTSVSFEVISEKDKETMIAQAHVPNRIDPLVNFLREFMLLPDVTRQIVAYRLIDASGHERHTYPDIGKKLRMSPQAVEAKHRKAIEEIPALAAPFARKMIKQSRRKHSRVIAALLEHFRN